MKLLNSVKMSLRLLLLVAATPGLVVAQDEVAANSTAPLSDSDRVTQLMEAGRFEDAISFCDSWLRTAEQSFGSESLQLAAPLNCLGEASFAENSMVRAVGFYERSVKIIERSAGVFDPALRDPLEGLGRALFALKEYDAATSELLRAKDVTHRNQGIFNLDQSSIVNRLTAIYFMNADVGEANREQRFLLQTHEEQYGDTPQLTPALRRMAKWQQLMGRGDLARNQYRRALSIMEAAYGPDDLRLVGPLTDIADSYMNAPKSRRVMSGEGTRALKRIIALYDKQEFADQADEARAWTNLGDWYVRSGHRGRSRDAYAKAWNTLGELNESELVQDELFEYPEELEFEARPAGLNPRQIMRLPDGNVELQFRFTVDENGRVRNIHVVKDEIGSNILLSASRSNVRASRYRPRLVDGKPVATADVVKTLRFNFDGAKQDILERFEMKGQRPSGSEDTAEQPATNPADNNSDDAVTEENPAADDNSDNES